MYEYVLRQLTRRWSAPGWWWLLGTWVVIGWKFWGIFGLTIVGIASVYAVRAVPASGEDGGA